MSIFAQFNEVEFNNNLLAQMYLEDDVMTPNIHGEYIHVMSADDLPIDGNPEQLYKVTSTGDLYRYIDGQYFTYNPYAADEEDRLSPMREVITDNSAYMPSGGTGTLSVIYNFKAFIADQHRKTMHGWSYYDMLPKGILAKSDNLEVQQSKYFRNSHRSLMNQLREIIRGNVMDKGVEARDRLREELSSKLEAMGASVWVADGQFGFKYGNFVAKF